MLLIATGADITYRYKL